jgi:hypothetical protein
VVFYYLPILPIALFYNSREDKGLVRRIKNMLVAVTLVTRLTAPLALAEGNQVTLTGHLIDQMCGGEIKDAAKAKKHTKECALMDHCAQSGFGVLVDGKFVKFDADGSSKAKAFLEKSSKKKDIQVTVEGTQDGDLLTLSSIKER